MNLLAILLTPYIGEEICNYLSFEDLIALQCLLKSDQKLFCICQVADIKGRFYTLRGVNKDTLRIYPFIKHQNAHAKFLATIREGNLELVRIFLQIGIDVNEPGDWGKMAIDLACAHSHNDIIKMLLENGANVNNVNKYNATPLMEAANLGKYESVQILLEYRAEVNYANSTGDTALMRIFKDEYSPVVDLLIEYKANVNSMDEDEHTPLMGAAHHGNINIAKILLENKADVNFTNQYGGNALSWTPHKDSNMIKLLKTYGAHDNP